MQTGKHDQKWARIRIGGAIFASILGALCFASVNLPWHLAANAVHGPLQASADSSVQVTAMIETEPVLLGESDADDPAIWVHPTDPAQSLIIGTNEEAGLVVYDLAGKPLQAMPGGEISNVDVRYGFPLQGQVVDLVAASNQTGNNIVLYQINPATRQLAPVAAGLLQLGVQEAKGLCMYHSRVSGRYFAFVNDENGRMEQWELFDNGQGLIDGQPVRLIQTAPETEGCVADDELGWLYMAEEEHGIWKYRAEPDDNTPPVLVDRTGTGGHLTADVEGLTLYYAGDGKGYLIASSQGSNEFVVYRREGNNDFVTSFQVSSGSGTDAVSEASGVDITNVALGPNFPQGLFVTQDDENEGNNQNYKLVAWSVIAGEIQPALTIDTLWNPRTINPGQQIAVPAPPHQPLPPLVPLIQPTPTLPPASGAMPLPGQVAAVVETDPVPSGDDAADDPAIWVHPTDPAQSTIIGTDKDGGIAVYELNGRQLQYLPDGKMNNVDLRYNFPLGGQRVALVTASNRTSQSIAIYRVNPQTRQLENVAARTIPVGITEAYGACMYHSLQTDKYYFLVNDERGQVEQWELFDSGAGRVDGRSVRTFTIGTQTEGCVADDELAQLYVGEEQKGIWKYGAEPEDGNVGHLIDTTDAGGHLTADVEGLALYYGSNGTGYLIASSQGNDAFVIYRREGNNDYITTFQIGGGGGVDAVSGTDGIDVTNFPLGPLFPEGVFVTQDDSNDGGYQNYKLIPWSSIAKTVTPTLMIDTVWDPR